MDTTTFRLKPGNYFQDEHPKDLILLHFTAGLSASSAYQTWIAPVAGVPQHVSTAYVVDPGGTAYQFFPPQAWGYHLGMTQNNSGWPNDKRSIAIEIANPGPLRRDRKDPNQINWWPRDFGTRWCSLSETDRYVKAPYRGFEYYAAFPKPQHEAVRDLVGQLCGQFQIAKTLPPLEKRGVYDPVYFSQYKGIASHQNFRADKLDIGPAWDWSWLEVA